MGALVMMMMMMMRRRRRRMMAKMMNGRGLVILIGTSLTLQSYLMQSFQKFLTENFCRITCKRGIGRGRSFSNNFSEILNRKALGKIEVKLIFWK